MKNNKSVTVFSLNFSLINLAIDLYKSAISQQIKEVTSGYAKWFTAGGAIRIAHYDVIDDVTIWVQDGNCKK